MAIGAVRGLETMADFAAGLRFGAALARGRDFADVRARDRARGRALRPARGRALDFVRGRAFALERALDFDFFADEEVLLIFPDFLDLGLLAERFPAMEDSSFEGEPDFLPMPA